MVFASPFLAALAMLATGLVVFLMIDRDPLQAAYVVFVQPLDSLYGIGELFLKATPLLLCALGLGIGFRSNVWNIGAEGQLTAGALAGGGVALWLGDHAGGGGWCCVKEARGAGPECVAMA
jgi:simple sugar transport system permease protein